MSGWGHHRVAGGTRWSYSCPVPPGRLLQDGSSSHARRSYDSHMVAPLTGVSRRAGPGSNLSGGEHERHHRGDVRAPGTFNLKPFTYRNINKV